MTCNVCYINASSILLKEETVEILQIKWRLNWTDGTLNTLNIEFDISTGIGGKKKKNNVRIIYK